MKIKFDVSDRGFAVGTFKDLYDVECSIQRSFLATEKAIWLGRNKDYSGKELHAGRMHLSRKQVKSLIKVLQHFVDTGRLPEATD